MAYTPNYSDIVFFVDPSDAIWIILEGFARAVSLRSSFQNLVNRATRTSDLLGNGSCLIIGIIGSNIAFRYSRRKIVLRKMGTAIDFEKERRCLTRLKLFKLPRLRRINPLIVIIVGAAIGFAYLNIVGEPEGSKTGSPNALTGRVTHVRDGDTICGRSDA